MGQQVSTNLAFWSTYHHITLLKLLRKIIDYKFPRPCLCKISPFSTSAVYDQYLNFDYPAKTFELAINRLISAD